MPELAQAEFARVVRGGTIKVGEPPPIEPVVMALSSIARAAVRRVHKGSPSLAKAYYAGKVARFLRRGGNAAATARSYEHSLNRYIGWDSQMRLPLRQLDVGGLIRFSPDDAVRAIGHVVLDDGAGGSEARVLLWDELAIDASTAEMIALPVFEAVDARFGAGSTSLVHVLQLARGEKVPVLPARARTRHADVQNLLAGL